MTSDPSGEVLDKRALNRALLARQMLLERRRMPAIDAIRYLVGMQSQAPNPPYVGLWTRLVDFEFDELVGLMHDRQVVRSVLMRGTIHLVAAEDCLAFYPFTKPVFERTLKGMGEQDLEPVEKAARELLDEEPRSPKQLREMLAERFPDRDAETLGLAVRCMLPLIHVPPRGIWGAAGQAFQTTMQAWLGRAPEPVAEPTTMVLRYLAAFGPATVMDMQHWSGLTRLQEAFDRLGGRLRRFADEQGRVLYDLPDAPRPGPDAPAPVRFVPDFDNLLLSHADRTRIISEEHRMRVFTVNGIIRPTVLVDGFVAGLWKWEKKRGAATLDIELFGPVGKSDRTALKDEGLRLLETVAAGAKTFEVRFAES